MSPFILNNSVETAAPFNVVIHPQCCEPRNKSLLCYMYVHVYIYVYGYVNTYTLGYHSKTALRLCGCLGNWYNYILKIDPNIYVMSAIFFLCDV